MDFLSIETARQKRADARLNIATEGISDYLKDIFALFTSTRMSDSEAEANVARYFIDSSTKVGVAQFLNQTVNDDKWREKNLTDRPLQITTCFGVIDGVHGNNFTDLARCFKDMYTLSANIMVKYKDNTDLREKVFGELKKAKGDDLAAEYDKVMERHIGRLKATAPDGHRWLKTGNRNIPAVGTAVKMTWPVNKDGFYNWPTDQVLTSIDGPTVTDYKDFVNNLLVLADLYDRARLLVNNNGYNDPDDLDEDVIENNHIAGDILDYVCYDIDDLEAQKSTTAAEYVMFGCRGLLSHAMIKLLTR